MKTVFVVMCAEFIHPGHINIIKTARDLGEVTVGLATDEFNARYKRLAVMNFEQRKFIIENIIGVKRVIPQKTLDLAQNLRELKPDFFVHGDDWETGPRVAVRRQVIEILREWGGTLIEPPYTRGISSTRLHEAWRSAGATLESRRSQFRRLLEFQPLVHILQVSHPFAGMIGEQAQISVGGKVIEFDAFLYRNRPEKFNLTELARSAQETGQFERTLLDFLRITTRPVLVDALPLTGYFPDLSTLFQSLDHAGVTGIVLDEQMFLPNRMDATKGLSLESLDISPIASFFSSTNISQGLNRMSTLPCIDINRTPQGEQAAIRKASVYREAGADAILVRMDPAHFSDFLSFCRNLLEAARPLPLLAAIPDTKSIHPRLLVAAGVKGIAYSGKPIQTAADDILRAATNLLLASETPDPRMGADER